MWLATDCHVRRLTKREKKEIEHKKKIKGLADEHRKVKQW